MITNRSKQSAIQTSVCVCVPVSLQNITFFPHPYFFCVEQKLTHYIILPQRWEKKISFLTVELILADFASYLLCLLDQRRNPQIKRMG